MGGGLLTLPGCWGMWRRLFEYKWLGLKNIIDFFLRAVFVKFVGFSKCVLNFFSKKECDLIQQYVVYE